mgnify:FL=1
MPENTLEGAYRRRSDDTWEVFDQGRWIPVADVDPDLAEIMSGWEDVDQIENAAAPGTALVVAVKPIAGDWQVPGGGPNTIKMGPDFGGSPWGVGPRVLTSPMVDLDKEIAKLGG